MKNIYVITYSAIISNDFRVTLDHQALPDALELTVHQVFLGTLVTEVILEISEMDPLVPR